jgi:predicted dehydrogenase
VRGTEDCPNAGSRNRHEGFTDLRPIRSLSGDERSGAQSLRRRDRELREGRPAPADGIHIYGDAAREFVPLAPPAVPRGSVIDKLYAAVRQGVRPLHDGAWGRATLEVCLALRQSATSGREVQLLNA